MYKNYQEIRDARGLKDADVAKATGIGKSTFSDWKSGRSNPKQEKMQKIAEFLGVSVDFLINGEKPTLEISSKNFRRLPVTSFEVIKSLCEAEGISVSTLEKEMGYGNASLSKAKKIPADRIYELSQRFGVSMEFLMTGEEPGEEKKDLKKEYARLERQLRNVETLPLYYDGKPVDAESIDLLLKQVQISIALLEKSKK